MKIVELIGKISQLAGNSEADCQLAMRSRLGELFFEAKSVELLPHYACPFQTLGSMYDSEKHGSWALQTSNVKIDLKCKKLNIYFIVRIQENQVLTDDVRPPASGMGSLRRFAA